MCFHIDNLKALYYAFIHSHFSCWITSWCNSYPVHIWLLVLKKQVMRLITFASHQTLLHRIFLPAWHITHLPNVHLLCVRFIFKVSHLTLIIDIFPTALFSNLHKSTIAISQNLSLPIVHTSYKKMGTIFFNFIVEFTITWFKKQCALF